MGLKMGFRESLTNIVGKGNHRNRYYGHSDILKAYTGVKLPYTVPGEIQHGWNRFGGTCVYPYLTERGEEERLSQRYVWNRHNLETCVEWGYKNVVAIGAPFLYLPLPESIDSELLGNKSLLLFPHHSCECEPFRDPVRTHQKFLEDIQVLLSIFNPVTVCLYWMEFQNRDIVRLFEDAGIQVVTLGHRDNNPLFLRNFQALTLKYAYVSSNIYSTAVFYALYLRRKVFIFGKAPVADINRIPEQYRPRQQARLYLYPELLWPNFDHQSHFWIGEKELGLEFKRSPAELCDLFGWYPTRFAKQCSYRAISTTKSKARFYVSKARRIPRFLLSQVKGKD